MKLRVPKAVWLPKSRRVLRGMPPQASLRLVNPWPPPLELSWAERANVRGPTDQTRGSTQVGETATSLAKPSERRSPSESSSAKPVTGAGGEPSEGRPTNPDQRGGEADRRSCQWPKAARPSRSCGSGTVDEGRFVRSFDGVLPCPGRSQPTGHAESARPRPASHTGRAQGAAAGGRGSSRVPLEIWPVCWTGSQGTDSCQRGIRFGSSSSPRSRQIAFSRARAPRHSRSPSCSARGTSLRRVANRR